MIFADSLSEFWGDVSDDYLLILLLAVAASTALIPFLSKKYRRYLMVLLLVITLTSLTSRRVLALQIAGSAVIGWIIGSIIQVIPRISSRAANTDYITEVLREHGIQANTVKQLVTDARGSKPFLVIYRNGSRAFLKLSEPVNKNADALYKLYRRLLFRHVEDETPYVSTKQKVEHEALMTLMAREAGVKTPAVREIIADPRGEHVYILFDFIKGKTLAEINNKAVDENVLSGLWQQIKKLRAARIAHRDLRCANVMLDESGGIWLIDFGFAQSSATKRRLNIDIAELMVSLALRVGHKKAVDSAIEVLGADMVGEIVPLLQGPAFTKDTRAQLRGNRELLNLIRAYAVEKTSVANHQLQKLARITPMNVFIAFGLFFGIFIVLPQFGQLGQIVTKIDNINPGWLAIALAASAATYVASAYTLIAAAQGALIRMPLHLTSVAALAGSFANRFTPFGIGGFALTSRYLQCFGSSKPQSITSVGLPVIAGTITTVALMLIVAPSAARELLNGTNISPTTKLVAVLAAGLLLVGGSAFMIFHQRLNKLIRAGAAGAWASAKKLVRSGKVTSLLAGSLLVTLSYVLAMFASVKAFGLDIGVIQAFVVFTAGSAIGQATPTPGGLGGKEAIYVAGLIAFDVSASGAVAAVLLFRLVTFWLPMIPGALAFRYLKHSAYF
ncbi:flippase-like domain-containing protein [Candidatus Saccharibacteria bacterium]|nr:flippase-like domain-containing protein [Candidatus Saccharibacteria bacterium]